MAHWLTDGQPFSHDDEAALPLGEDPVDTLYATANGWIKKIKEDLIRVGLWDPPSR